MLRVCLTRVFLLSSCQYVYHLVLGLANADLEELVLEQVSSSGACFWVLVQALAHHLS